MKLNLPTIKKLRDALLQCQCMQNEQSRNTVIQDLPDDIKGNIPKGGGDYVIAVNIIKTCVAYPDGMAKLLEIIDLYDGQSNGWRILQAEWQNINQRQQRRQNRRSNKALPYYFDLQGLVKRFRLATDHKQGLSGFFIRYPSARFVKQVCQRIESVWWPDKIRFYNGILDIKAHIRTVDEALAVVKNHAGLLQTHDVLIGMIFTNQADLNTFWSKLDEQDFIATDSPKRLMLVAGIDPQFDTPPTLVELEKPQFDDFDFRDWVREICEAQKWSDAVHQAWFEHFSTECRLSDSYHIEKVYDHLEATTRELQNGIDETEFITILQERQANYAP